MWLTGCYEAVSCASDDRGMFGDRSMVLAPAGEFRAARLEEYSVDW
jgi:hypothetical protein